MLIETSKCAETLSASDTALPNLSAIISSRCKEALIELPWLLNLMAAADAELQRAAADFQLKADKARIGLVSTARVHLD